jgi:hypothetical protein
MKKKNAEEGFSVFLCYDTEIVYDKTLLRQSRVGILQQNAKPVFWNPGIFEVLQNSKISFLPNYFFKHCFIPALYMLFILPRRDF